MTSVHQGCNLLHLDFSGNPLKERGVSALCTGLCHAERLKALILDKSFEGSGGEKLVTSLALLIGCLKSLKYLSLAGGFKKIVLDLLPIITNNTTLEELNLSNNKGGDQLALALADFLRGSSTIKGISLDKNQIGLAGWQSIRASLRRNSSFEHLPFPWKDLEKIQHQNPKESYVKC